LPIGPAYVSGPRVLNSISRRDREKIAYVAYSRPRNGGISTLPWSFGCQSERLGRDWAAERGANEEQTLPFLDALLDDGLVQVKDGSTA
jgi:hypothetical protein